MELSLVNKVDGVTVPSHSWLLQLLPPEKCERACYPEARAHLPSASLCISTWLLLSVVLILMHSTGHWQITWKKEKLSWLRLQNPPKTEAITLPTDTDCLNFLRGGVRTRVFSLFVLRLWYRFEMVKPGFILSSQSAVEILGVNKAIQKCPGNVNSFQPLLGCHSRDSSCSSPRSQLKQYGPNQN